MVYLTMSSTIVEALKKIQGLERLTDEKGRLHSKEQGVSVIGEDERSSTNEEETEEARGYSNDGEKQDDSIGVVAGKTEPSKEPSLLNPKLGNPISHEQIIDLSRQLKAQGLSPRSLDILLRGARVYFPPLPPKPEPTSEYKALMARLRREEEARSYERMTNPPPPMETFAQRFPMSSAAHAFPSYQEPKSEDEVTYEDINRQMAMIANVLLSILACAGAIWIAARWWSTPARLALSMSGSLLVGVAEVVVYGGYIRRVSEAKGKEKSVQEIKEVVRTWVVGGTEEGQPEEPVLLGGKDDPDGVKVRKRKKEVS